MKRLGYFLLLSTLVHAGEPVARWDGQVVERTELTEAVQRATTRATQQGRPLPSAAQLQRQVLEELINRKLLLQAAASVPHTNLDARVTLELAGASGRAGLSATEVRENLLIQDAVAGWTASLPAPSDVEVKQYYEAHRSRFQEPPMAHARHILIRVPPHPSAEVEKTKRAEIAALRARVEKGEDFAAVARAASEDASTAGKGGDLGTFPPGVMVPELDQAAFNQPVGQLSGVIETRSGYHLLQVQERTTGEIPLAEVQERLRQNLQQEKLVDAVHQHLAQLRTTAKVEILLP